MENELELLEQKIEQVIGLVESLRSENEVLKNQIATGDEERIQLRRTITAARERLEALFDKLPEDL